MSTPDYRYQIVLDDFKSLELDFRINDLDESLEVLIDGTWEMMNRTTEAITRTRLRELGYGITGKKKANRKAVEECWITLAHTQRYNPIKDYFKAIRPLYPPRTEADSYKPYIIPDLLKDWDNPDGYLSRWLFRWMCGAIAKVYHYERNAILVMSGRQRIGKSSFVRWLCPIPDRYREAGIRPDNKDDRLRLIDTFIQEVPELGNVTRRADIESFKDFVTRKEIVERPPYADKPIKKPAICSFFATVNPDGAGFLNDPTGNSRFLVTEVNRIDFAYTNYNRDLVWSEALWFCEHTYKPWELTKAEQDAQAQINNQFEMVNALEDVVDQYLEITNNSDDWASTVQIRNYIGNYYRYSSETQFNRELAKVLYAKGLERCREPFQNGSKHRWGWRGIKTLETEKIK